jgi:hypothetical protein
LKASRVAWDELPDSIAMLGAWRVGVLFEPAGSHPFGGDRFDLSSAPFDALAFYLADATGHGRRGAEFWQVFGGSFFQSWQAFASAPGERSLVRFVREVNDALYEMNLDGKDAHVLPQLCLAAGWISRERTLVYAGFGLGIHVRPVTTVGPHHLPANRSFGFRLGWVPSSEWPRHEGALVIRRIPGLQRLWLASDAFFGDDHWDPEAALRRVDELDRAITGLTIENALSEVRRVPHAGDDATFVILERTEETQTTWKWTEQPGPGSPSCS